LLNFSAVSFSLLLARWLYVSNVVAIFECPSQYEIAKKLFNFSEVKKFKRILPEKAKLRIY
jgi:hypothetical protein